VVNADVLATMSQRARRWFLSYGLIIAVLVVRGLMPLLIVYVSNPSLGLGGAITATFSSNPLVRQDIEAQKPILLAGGGMYLVLLFLHWIFVEQKDYAFFLERHVHQKFSVWFYASASMILTVTVWLTMRHSPLIAFGTAVGSTAFFITNGFKQNAEAKERELTHGSHLSDLSKIVYLEVLDAAFSIDGVLGAFAFTLSVPLILLGNGLGAYVVRAFTVRGIKTVKKYRYLKNGAMYSVASLGAIMLMESLGIRVPAWLPTLITFAVVGLFLWLSARKLRADGEPPKIK
jgi:hypothetical protein